VAKSQEITAFASKTFVTLVPHGTEPPYLVWHPAKGTNTQERVTGPRTTMHPRFTGHIVGVDADQTQLLADLVEAKLFPGGLGIVLSVSGEKSSRMWFESPLPVQASTDPLPAIVYAVVEVGWTADPA
jgi:hypothetical protein